MALDSLINAVEVDGMVNTVPTAFTDTVTVQLVDGLTVVKTADKLSWAGTEALTFTVTIDNQSGEPYSQVKIEDTLDISKVALVENSVLIDGVAAPYDYDDTLGELVIYPDADLLVADQTTVRITYQVTKVTP